MLGIENLAVFVGTGILLNLYPGPDTLYTLGRSLSQGRGAGVAAALGISSGALIHTLLGACGLSALLATSAHAFALLKLLGCVYLVYQGVSLLFADHRRSGGGVPVPSPAGLWRIYRQGTLTNLLNPKVAVFFLAFLPQFISPASSNKALSFLVLGLLFLTTGTLWCLVLAVGASSLSRRLHRSPQASRRLGQFNGLLLILLGINLAFSRYTF